MGRLVILVLLSAAAAAPTWGQAPPDRRPPLVAPENRMPPPPAIRDLGGDRYAIGKIVVDRSARAFSAPGRILNIRPDAPLEFIVASNPAAKSYESLVELDVNAFEFNIACILIGLTRHPDQQPKAHFDSHPVEGDPVDVTVEWTLNGKTYSEPAAHLIRQESGVRPVDEWVYTGSRFNIKGAYQAYVSGTLIGFVHDEDSIVQHHTGLGLGDYGAVTLDPSVVPPPGTPIRLTVHKRPPEQRP